MGPVEPSDREQKDLLVSLKIKSTDMLIGVDGGALILKKWGLRAQFAVGDWDSLAKKNLLWGTPHITLPTEKDRSDLFYAVIAAIEAGAHEIVCTGVTGGRPDHHLAMLYDLSRFSTGVYGKLKSVQAVGVEGQYHFLSAAIPRWKGTAPVGSTVSIFPIGSPAQGVTLTGFHYPLKNGRLGLSSHGLSNRTLRRNFQVCLRKGQLLVIMPRCLEETQG